MQKVTQEKRNRDHLSITAHDIRFSPETLEKNCYLSSNGSKSFAQLLPSTKRSVKIKSVVATKQSALLLKTCYLNFDKDA
jgi:hypothetical protein